MALAISEEHRALQETARRFLTSRCPPGVPRAYLDAADEMLPPFWDELGEMGWFGLHLPEAAGGQGYGFAELAVIVDELGRAVAPGPFLPTVLASAAMAAAGRHDLARALADGSTPAALAWHGALTATTTGDGSVVLDGTIRPVLGAGLARTLVLPAAAAQGILWCVVPADQAAIFPIPNLDLTRRVAGVTVDHVTVAPDQQLTSLSADGVHGLVATLLAAECAGGAAWCVETASSYAKVREQFGRPIGQFQAVKHRCADMLIAAEQAAGVAWDGAQVLDESGLDTAPLDEGDAELAAAIAGVIAPDAYFGTTKDCIQVLGGIGFTWEHDAHMYLRRATAIRQLVAGTAAWRARTARLALAGTRRRPRLQLPPEAETTRAEVRAFAESVADLDRHEQRQKVVDAGYFVPYWAPPWGRNANAVEQLVIDEEFRRLKIKRPNLGIGAWAAPTIAHHGTPDQQERWVRPTLTGETTWCQLFSEPGAGSDLASLSTKAVRTADHPSGRGWLLSGQKVWTSMARDAAWGMCLARTSTPSSRSDRHFGITYFVVDMKSEGLDIRPLRELTGHAMFNEVFLSDVFVPDDCVIGEVDHGWPLARTTLANERVAMSTGSSFGGGVEALLKLIDDTDDAVVLDRTGELVAEAHSLALLGLRTTARAMSGPSTRGSGPGSESSVRKLLGVEHDQRVQEFGLGLLGAEGATTEGPADQWTYGFLANRCLTIAGGTSEIQRNVIAERLLGLPRDP